LQALVDDPGRSRRRCRLSSIIEEHNATGCLQLRHVRLAETERRKSDLDAALVNGHATVSQAVMVDLVGRRLILFVQPEEGEQWA